MLHITETTYMRWAKLSEWAIQLGDCTVCRVVIDGKDTFEAWRHDECLIRTGDPAEAKAACEKATRPIEGAQ